jgi:cation transport regulator
MPYQSVSELPSAVKRRYGDRGREAFMAAFNRVVYEEGGDESRAFAIAHTAAKQAEASGSRRAAKRVKARRRGSAGRRHDTTY